MTDQLEMFETPQQRRSREHNESLAAYMEARRVPGGFQCPDCGGIDRNDVLHWMNHGIMGTRCLAERFARNHTLYDLRQGDRDRYIEATRRLRAIAQYRAAQRRIAAEGPPF